MKKPFKHSCPECGTTDDFYKVEGLCTDRDGIREDYWCEECKIHFGMRAHGFTKRYVLHDPYPLPEKREELIALAKKVLTELDFDWEKK